MTSEKDNYFDWINEQLLERGYEKEDIDDFWEADSKTANGDGETIIDSIFKYFHKDIVNKGGKRR